MYSTFSGKLSSIAFSGSSFIDVTSTITEPFLMNGATSRITAGVWLIGTDMINMSLIPANCWFDSI